MSVPKLIAFVNNLAAPHRVRFVASVVCFGALVCLVLFLAGTKDRQTPFGPALGADYGAYYVAGTIMNSGSPQRLYDVRLQERLHRQLFPRTPADEMLPYPHAPFFAVLLRPLATLPYEWSYLVWLAVNMGAFVAGFLLLWSAAGGLPNTGRAEALLVAASFLPVLFEGWLGGQTTGILLLCLGGAIYAHSRGRLFTAGLIIAFLTLKPTLLVLLVPMFLLTRQVRALAGFLVGALALGAVSLAAVGWQGLRGYMGILEIYATARHVAPEVFKTWKYIDGVSFFRLLAPPQLTWSSPILSLAFSLAVFAVLVQLWWRIGRGWSRAHRLSWASVLLWTPIVSPLSAVYDASFLIPAVVLTASVLESASAAPRNGWTPGFRALVVALYAAAMVSQPLARCAGVQLLTIAIIAIGIYQVRLAYGAGWLSISAWPPWAGFRSSRARP
jgi:hypothetical protein